MKRAAAIAAAALCGLVAGGWMAFDGVHALATGDYVTPETGEYAGRLGPWAELWRAAGIEPRSIGVKLLHVVQGTAWLGATFAFALARGQGAARRFLGIAAVLALWYLPFGTLLGVAQLAILFATRESAQLDE